jgi:hypothetical protein
LIEYQQALNFHTDNQPSGSQLFIVNDYRSAETAA